MRERLSERAYYFAIFGSLYFVTALGFYRQSPHPLDFGVYLSAAFAFFNQQNSWDAVTLSNIAHVQGYLPPNINTLGLWTPPTVFPILYPFTLVRFPVAIILWLLTNIGVICLIFHLLTKCFSQFTIRSQVFQAILFPPILALLIWGQISAFVLLGYVSYLYFSKQNKQFLAGCCLYLTTFKPHLGFLVWIFIAWSVLTERSWKTAVGFFLPLSLVFFCFTIISPAWYVNYLSATANPPLQYSASNLFGAIHKFFFPDFPGVQFLGAALSAGALILFIFVTKHHTKILSIMPGLLLASVVFAPYGWVYDQIVVFPAFGVLSYQLSLRQPMWVVWSVLLLCGGTYYFILSDTWGNNDWRPMYFPCILLLLYLPTLLTLNLRVRVPH